MSEQEAADSSGNSRRTLVYYYHHKRVKTNDGGIKTHAGKFINSEFFGSAYPSNQKLQQTEDKLRSMREALMVRRLQQMRERLSLLQQDLAGKVDDEQFKKRAVLEIVQMYIIKKQEDEVKKLEEDYDKLIKAMMHIPLPPSSPPSQPAVAVVEAEAEASTPQPLETTPPLLGV